MTTRQAGFTLVEVLVALVVVAVVLTAVIVEATQAARTVGHVKQKTIATWVASNQLAAVELASSNLSAAEIQGRSGMAGTTWPWRQRVSRTDMAELKRVDVDVFAPVAAVSTMATKRSFDGLTPLVSLSTLVRTQPGKSRN